MTAEMAVDLVREALRVCLLVGGPLLAVTFAVGLVCGLLQAATQMHETALSLVPKLIVAGLIVAAALPWLVGRLVEFTSYVLADIPLRL